MGSGGGGGHGDSGALALSVDIHPCYEGIIYNPHIVLNCVVQPHSLSSVVVKYVILAEDDQ